MANQCHYLICETCGDEYCARGCSYRCKCRDGTDASFKNIKSLRLMPDFSHWLRGSNA